MHQSALCVNTFGDHIANGIHIPVLADNNGVFSSWYLKGWMKTSITLKALILGYNCMFMDIDMVIFKDPLLFLQPTTDVAVTVDCWEGYHPRSAK